MATAMALGAQMRAGVAEQARADLVVGIPSYRNAGTIGHVARAAADGLRRYFPDARSVIVNADGGSSDGTPERVRAEANGIPTITGRYEGPSGKGSAFRAIFEAVSILGARACAVVDSDLRSITPDWIERLIGPVVRGDAEYVAPLYARHKYDGTITNTIAYPLTRALYGVRVRQPIGGEFGFNGDLAQHFIDQPVWETDVARFGIDIFMTTRALVRGVRIAQAFLGAKIHDPKDPGADLGPMFTQVVGTMLALARKPEAVAVWSAVKGGAREVPVIGDIREVEPEPVTASVPILVEKFRAGADTTSGLWKDVLSPTVALAVSAAAASGDVRAMSGELWARAVYDVLAAPKDRDDTASLARALLPLYFARVATFIEEVADLDQAGAERIVESQARTFEQLRGYLVERWV